MMIQDYLDDVINDDDIMCDDEVVFDSLVGNPPYQSDTGNGATAIYHHTMNIAEKISEKISMVYPARWVLTGRGNGIKEFRTKELESPHYKKFFIYSPNNPVFDNVLIRGGVNIFLWVKNNKQQHIDYYYDNHYDNRKTLANNFPIIILKSKNRQIIEKINTKNSIMNIIITYPGKFSQPQQVEKMIKEYDNTKPGITLLYSGKGGGIRKASLNKNVIDKDTNEYKVFASSTASGHKELLPHQDRIFLGKPHEISASTFLQIGLNMTEQEAKNCLLYLKTDFAGFLLGNVIVTHHASKNVYQLIPNINFKTGEIIDKPGYFLNFTLSTTLDEQLAKIYDLTDDDINIISSSIKPWRNKYSLTADGINKHD